MEARRKIIIGNWKMNGRSKDLVDIDLLFKKVPQQQIDIVIAPPATLLYELKGLNTPKNLLLSGQNCHQVECGAYTGEISAAMLKEAGANYVILGHSERRTVYKETSTLVRLKALEAVKQGLIPIICVGENLKSYENNQTLNVIERQLKVSLNSKIICNNLVIAYEPVWAIGSNKTPSPEEIEKVHSFIKNHISERFGEHATNHCRIIYGGSVNKNNALKIFSLINVDGGLIGGASLKATDFLELIMILKNSLN